MHGSMLFFGYHFLCSKYAGGCSGVRHPLCQPQRSLCCCATTEMRTYAETRLAGNPSTCIVQGKTVIEQTVAVRMSPQHANALAGVLMGNVREYEKQAGKSNWHNLLKPLRKRLTLNLQLRRRHLHQLDSSPLAISGRDSTRVMVGSAGLEPATSCL